MLLFLKFHITPYKYLRFIDKTHFCLIFWVSVIDNGLACEIVE